MKLLNPEIRIETTNRCNAACVICPREKMTRPRLVMEYPFFCDLADQAKALGAEMISLFGYGEPLKDDNLVDKIRYCNRLALKTFITTNASLLNTDWSFALIEAGLNHIRFSMHGIYNNYERIHKPLKFNDVWRNIANFMTINDVKFGHKCRVGATVIPMHSESVDDIRGFWNGFVDELEIWRPHNWCNGRLYRWQDRKLKTCGRPFNGPVQIQSDGTVIPCCFLTNSEIILGDTNKNTIEEILKGDLFNELRRKHQSGDLAGLACEKCDQLNIEEKSPLIYSSIDNEINKTSGIKFKLQTEALK